MHKKRIARGIYKYYIFSLRATYYAYFESILCYLSLIAMQRIVHGYISEIIRIEHMAISYSLYFVYFVHSTRR